MDNSFARKTGWFVRWTLAALFLLGGMLILSRDLSDPGIWWLGIGVPHFSFSLPVPSHFLLCAIAISFATTAIFLGWTTLSAEARWLVAVSDSDAWVWVTWLIFYCATVAALVGLLEHRSGIGLSPWAYCLAAASLTLMAALSWCLAAMPVQFWSKWISSDPKVLPTAAVAGALTYFGGHHLTTVLMPRVQEIILPLQAVTLRLVAALLGIFTRQVVFDPHTNLIGTQAFSVFVDVACAGWEGIGLFCTLFGIYLWFYRRDFRFPAVLLLLPAGVLIVWFCNAIRLVMLIVLGSFFPSIAIDGFHSVAGWLFFDAVTVALVVASRHLKLFAKLDDSANREPPTQTREILSPAGANPAAPYLVPLLIIVATSMITRIFYNGFDLLYPVRFALGGGALWAYRRQIRLRWNISWSAVALGVVAFAAWLAFPQGDRNASANATFSLGLDALPVWGGWLWISCRALTAIAVVPIAEELAFRGYLLRKLVDADFQKVPPGTFTWSSFLVCSLLFGGLHVRWLAGCVAGMIFAVAIYRRGLLADAIVSHGIANGLLTGYVLLTHQWYLWS